uniref:Uncharacterized protein n=1 Tax=Rhizophora mucronata TaxID=61149 RepID=A0A2P2LHI9_RHIMU
MAQSRFDFFLVFCRLRGILNHCLDLLHCRKIEILSLSRWFGG